MREDPGFHRDVERMRPVVAGLEALPSDAWERREVPPLPDLPPLPAAPAPQRPRPRWQAWRPVAAVAACAALIARRLGIGALCSTAARTTPPAIALARSTTAGRRGRRGTRRLVRGRGAPPPGERPRPQRPDGFYELWLLDGPERLLSLGAFRVPASGAADDRAAPVDVTDFRFIDVSVEAKTATRAIRASPS